MWRCATAPPPSAATRCCGPTLPSQPYCCGIPPSLLQGRGKWGAVEAAYRDYVHLGSLGSLVATFISGREKARVFCLPNPPGVRRRPLEIPAKVCADSASGPPPLKASHGGPKAPQSASRGTLGFKNTATRTQPRHCKTPRPSSSSSFCCSLLAYRLSRAGTGRWHRIAEDSQPPSDPLASRFAVLP